MDTKMDKILAEISAGELIDKITILEIKTLKISEKDKLFNINKELSSLNDTMKKFIKKDEKLKIIKKLKEVNLKLWDIENAKRESEKNKNFGKEFVELSRSVYKYNDLRAKIKLDVNIYLGSNIKEVKSYN